ncbi:MAG: 7-cyano-7-deazaguanine synthase [Thermoplasmatota archaeon]
MDYKVVILMSTGIDSPVAAHLMCKAGADVNILHIDNGSFTGDNEIDKLRSIFERLTQIYPDIDLYEVFFEDVQREISSKANQHFQCILCKRMMYRAAEKLASEIDADAIVTGESMGQVASQTLSNLQTQDSVVELPIHRPLIGLDKNEIIEIAKEIGTYQISIKPGICCLLTPDKPRVKSDIDELKKLERELEYNSKINSLKFKKID